MKYLQGDSGGPVVELSESQPILQGLVSWGKGCGAPTHPGVNTRVSKFIEWINNIN